MRSKAFCVTVLLLLALPLTSQGASPSAVAGKAEPVATARQLAWHIERVDAPKLFEDMTDRSLALDQAGHPHIAYGQDMLYYARHDGAQWHLETVDNSGQVGKYASLDLDAGGRPHIAYYDWDHQDLKYAHYTGTGWNVEVVDSTGHVGEHTSLAVDDEGHPHISYYDSTNWGLKYAHHDGSAWHVQMVDTTYSPSRDVGWYTSLALDGEGRPHISYYALGAKDLKYAHQDGADWHIETVPDPSASVGRLASLAVDSASRPHISYWDDTQQTVKHAYLAGTAWQIETVDVDGSADSSIALDALDRPLIAYRAANPANYLRLARWDGAVWKIEEVALEPYAGSNLSLAVDAVGRPSISYTGWDVLYWSHFTGAAWQTEEVDYSGEAGYDPSLDLDSSGRPHISYRASGSGLTNTHLRYAWYDGTAWKVEIVDSTADVGWATSLAMDSADRPHISYLDADNRQVKYAHHDGTAWRTESVGSMGWVGCWYTSLALDPSGHPHIAYCDDAKVLYTYYDGTTWHGPEVVYDHKGWTLSMALAVAGQPHLGFCRVSCTPYCGCQDAMHAYRDGSGWHVETVDGPSAAHYLSVALDPSGRPSMAYSRWGDEFRLRYARSNGTSWEIETIPGAGTWYVSLEIDSAGLPHVSYQGDGEVGYALKEGTTWRVMGLDDGSFYNTSLDLSPSGAAYIGYFDGANDDLKVARSVEVNAVLLPLILRNLPPR